MNFILKVIAILSGLRYLGILRPLIYIGIFTVAFLIVITV